MIAGDRVTLTKRAAAARMRFVRSHVRANQRKTTHCGVNWNGRVGTVRSCKGGKVLVSGGTNLLVIWDGTHSPESIPMQALEKISA